MTNGILVLVDMNGVVCYRSEEPVAGVRADLFVRRKNYYKRHGVEQFVEGLVQAGFAVAVYSSIMAHNLQSALNALMPKCRKLLTAELDRDMNKRDPNGQEEWDTIRDMDKVWRTLRGYGPKNTILLDNEARKFCEHTENGIVVPEFGPSEVLTRQGGTLDSLKDYLLDLGRAAPQDVRDYLRGHPYDGRKVRLPSAPAGAGSSAAAAAARLPSAPAAALPSAAGGAAARLPSGAAAGAAGAGQQLSAAASSAASSLAAALAKLAVDSRPAANTDNATVTAPAATVPSAAAASSPVATAAATASPAAEGIPVGTRLLLVCIDSHTFVMSGDTGNEQITVRGPVTEGLRISHKMDYHLLVDEASKVGCELTVEREPRSRA